MRAINRQKLEKCVVALAVSLLATGVGVADARDGGPDAVGYGPKHLLRISYHDCGVVEGASGDDVRLLAHRVRCRRARRVAEYYFGRASKPKGWWCSASLRRCFKGDPGEPGTRIVKFKNP